MRTAVTSLSLFRQEPPGPCQLQSSMPSRLFPSSEIVIVKFAVVRPPSSGRVPPKVKVSDSSSTAPAQGSFAPPGPT